MPATDLRYGIVLGTSDPAPWQRDCIAHLSNRLGRGPEVMIASVSDVDLQATEVLAWILNLALSLPCDELAGAVACPVRGFAMRSDEDHPGLAQIRFAEHRRSQGTCRVLRSGRWQKSRRTPTRLLGVVQSTLSLWPSTVPPDARTDHHDGTCIGWSTLHDGINAPSREQRGVLGRLRSRLWQDHWEMGLIEGPIDRYLAEPVPKAIRWLDPRGGEGFGADGLPFQLGERTFIAFEAMDKQGTKGVIALREVDPRGMPMGPAKVVLETGHHMSYPFVMAWEGAMYMVPECSASGRLDYYRMGDDPWTWTHAGALFEDIGAIDPTLFEHDGRLWMFYGRPDAGSNDALFLASSTSLFGPWQQHPMNPVKVDAGAARCAGPVTCLGGALYRLGQDCTDRYGARVVVHRIETLNDSAYRETALACPAPHPAWRSPAGMHTMAVLGDHVLVDACRERLVPPGILLRRMMARLCKTRPSAR